jgi:hypothetical protein
MSTEPYARARRVFWIVENGSSHRGQPSIERLQGEWPDLVLVHLPFYASWLSQIEIVFSVIWRKVLTPNVVASVQAVFDRLDAFEHHCNQIAKPFESNFARRTGEIPLRTGMSRDLLYRPRSPSRVLSDMSRMGSRNPGTAKYSGGVQSPQSVVLCSDVVESGQTRVDAQIGPGSSNGVRVSRPRNEGVGRSRLPVGSPRSPCKRVDLEPVSV